MGLLLCPTPLQMTLAKLLFLINIFSQANRALNDALSRKTFGGKKFHQKMIIESYERVSK